MARPLLEMCGNGHVGEWMMRSNGQTRAPSRSCRACRRQRSAQRQQELAAQSIRLPRPGPNTPTLAWAPLEAALVAREIHPTHIINPRTVVRWRRNGTLPISSADVICCDVLGVHPTAVYGMAWYEESA
jgi:hypothetical protein